MPKGSKTKKLKSKGVKKTKLKVKKKASHSNDAKMVDDGEAKSQETSREVFKRHTAEKKQLQREVKELKRQRKKLPRKGNKDAKKALSHKIEKLIADVKERHLAELATAGIDKDVADADV
eukprot:CAMPEP_0169145688 /NCGR_PEP_ID=MMETSP1015-20121227/47069_1 /TAXON_ID=342587 /ORGANISM="Karlodinium micrum, Strain CCMP2283" /LENGTH=119 /DNA_ID=CAMNT_0009213343 /DNA_START=41 /DNA_END=396 /DNA_ORIENTATION=-